MLIQDVKRPARRKQPRPGSIISRKLRRLSHKKGLSTKQREELGIKTDHQLRTKSVWDVTLRLKK
ncbi:MAG: hypothetical protein M3P98_02055 [bacterium]|nr:hypothetical protein [bacterium]